MWRSIVWYTFRDDSQERATSIFRVEEQVQQATSLLASYPEDSTLSILYNHRHDNLHSNISFKMLLCHTVRKFHFIINKYLPFFTQRKPNMFVTTDFTAALNAAVRLLRPKRRYTYATPCGVQKRAQANLNATRRTVANTSLLQLTGFTELPEPYYLHR
jgi:hypothetical protein